MYPEERSLVKEMQGRPFVLLGVNTDRKMSTARKAVKKNKLNWRSFYDGKSRKITGPFKIRSFPTVMLVNHQGVIEYPNLRGKKLIAEIKRLVKEAEDDGMEGVKIKPAMRVFLDRTGKHRIEAVAEAINPDRVELRKKDGQVIAVDLVELSRADQSYLRTIDLPTLEDEGSASETAVESEHASDSPSPMRRFVDASGKHEVLASIVRVKDGKVTLKKADGSLRTVAIDSFCQDDQQFIEDWK